MVVNITKKPPDKPNLTQYKCKKAILKNIIMPVDPNIKILPFVASILVILFTYLLTVQITEKRFAGIIAILFIL